MSNPTTLPVCELCGQESCAPVHMTKDGHDFQSPEPHDLSKEADRG